MPLLGSMSRVLWASGAKAGWVNQKSGVLVNPVVFSSRGNIRHSGTGRQGRLWLTGAIGEVLSGTYICS